MPVNFRQSTLWQRTLGLTDDSNQESVDSLREHFLSFREYASQLAEEIRLSMPMFTDHGIDHIDSLWGTASRLMGEDFPINPAEAFVLGGAFILHDLGMGLASYKNGVQDIEDDPLFKDLMALHDSEPEKRRGDQPGARMASIVTVLRQRHAQQASKLLDQKFKSDDGRDLILLSDATMLDAFGSDIGVIAQSHWWDVDDLPAKLPVAHGVSASFPEEWEVNPIKLACILRLADATHIDGKRAPRYLHAFRPQSGVSEDHWYFQQRMNRPRVRLGRLEFTSSQSFGDAESRAWWLAHDTVAMIDDELRRVDSLCADNGLPQFLASSVAGIGTPERLARYVTVRDWQPMDASLRVTKVSSVIQKLGGEALYGRSPWIALRELIANAADASAAVHHAEKLKKPSVHVRLYEDVGRFWIEVEDHGIGMSAQSLVSSLTDFGNSRWQSLDALNETPGLAADGFRPRGRFGIGFFSIFMIADRVEVKSLRWQAGSDSTNVLIFENGLDNRPLLKPVSPRDRMTTHGTVVRARLLHDPLSEDGLFGTEAVQENRSQMLRDILEERCALLDTDLYFHGPEDIADERIVEADSWKTCSARDLFQRIYRSASRQPMSKQMYAAWENVFAEHEQQLKNDAGDVVGRAVLAAGIESDSLTDVWWWPSPTALTYVGGLLSDYIYDCLGVFVGEPLKADRNSSFPVASEISLRGWASSQAQLTSSSRYATSQTRYGAANLARSVGEAVPNLPCAFTGTGELAALDLESWIGGHDEVILIPTYELLMFHGDDGRVSYIDRTRGREVVLPDNAIVMDFFSRWFFPEEISKRPKDPRFGEYGSVNSHDWNPRHWWYNQGAVGSTGLVLEAALAAWSCTPDDIASSFEEKRYGVQGDMRQALASRVENQSVMVDAYVLHRPTSP